MFYSARQLDQMHRTHGRIVLPYRARLTPMARDWVKHKGVTIGYAEAALDRVEKTAETGAAATGSPLLWWCDGPCGSVKAAITAAARTAPLVEMPLSADPAKIAAAVQVLGESVRQSQAAGGLIVVTTGAKAMLLANRCRHLRAVLGTSLQAVEAGIEQVAANVLVIEHPRLTLMQARNMIQQFVRGKRELDKELECQLSTMAGM